MVIYFVLFGIIFLASLFDTFKVNQISISLVIIFLIALIGITTFRDGIGTDFNSYKEIYKSIVAGQKDYISISDPLFLFLNQISSYIGGFHTLLFICTLSNLMIFCFLLFKYRLSIPIGLMTYYSLFFFNHNFNTIRHGLMASFIWLSFYYLDKIKSKKFISSIIIAGTTHISAIALLPFFILIKKQLTFFIQIVILCICFLLGVKWSLAFQVLNKLIAPHIPILDYYLNDFYSKTGASYKIGLGFFLYLFIFLLGSWKLKYFYNPNLFSKLLTVLFYGIATILLFYSFSIVVERIANILLMSLVFIFAYVRKLKLSNDMKLPFVIIISIVNLLFLIRVLNIPGTYQPLQFVPYTSIF